MWTDDCEDTLAVAQGCWPHMGWGPSLWGCLGAYLPSSAREMMLQGCLLEPSTPPHLVWFSEDTQHPAWL